MFVTEASGFRLSLPLRSALASLSGDGPYMAHQPLVNLPYCPLLYLFGERGRPPVDLLLFTKRGTYSLGPTHEPSGSQVARGADVETIRPRKSPRVYANEGSTEKSGYSRSRDIFRTCVVPFGETVHTMLLLAPAVARSR